MQARRRPERTRRKIELDQRLATIVGNLIAAIREFMDETSLHRHHARSHLDVLRTRIGLHLQSLRDEYGCAVTGDITRVLPR